MRKSHPYKPTTSFDGGNLDCGSGLLLLIRKHIDPLNKGQLLEIKSEESSVEEDLPAWCRLTKNDLISVIHNGNQRSFLVCKGKFDPKFNLSDTIVPPIDNPINNLTSIKSKTDHKPSEIPNFAVMNIGSWPRPIWLLDSLHKNIENKISNDQFEIIANDAVKLCVHDQEQAGVDVITDGEQRRDNYASFVANKLNNCQLIPLIDLLPLVDDPDKFSKQLEQLDVPAESIRHPAVFGKISRKTPLTLNEAIFLRTLTTKPIKVALPGPYLLTRTMWMECISDSAYVSREDLSNDIVKILREELIDLLDYGVDIIQFDEPVLTEVVFTGNTKGRSFMCGALGEKKPVKEELDFAASLIEKVIIGLPKERIGLHLCRGNWTADESKALSGSYELLENYFKLINVGILFLEHATKRAGSYDFLNKLINKFHLGVGLVNQKSSIIESKTDILNSLNKIQSIIGPKSDRKIFLVPDCGFATFADSPVSNANNAFLKLSALKSASLAIQNL